MARPKALPPATMSLAQLAVEAGLSERAAEHLILRSGMRPLIAKVGRGNQSQWLATDRYLLRALKQLTQMQCPNVWRIRVVSWWRSSDLEAVRAGRHLVVCPSREHTPVFITSTAQLGRLLAGAHAWVVDIATEIIYR